MSPDSAGPFSTSPGAGGQFAYHGDAGSHSTATPGMPQNAFGDLPGREAPPPMGLPFGSSAPGPSSVPVLEGGTFSPSTPLMPAQVSPAVAGGFAPGVGMSSFGSDQNSFFGSDPPAPDPLLAGFDHIW
jgi:hypothetical protein